MAATSSYGGEYYPAFASYADDWLGTYGGRSPLALMSDYIAVGVDG